MPTDVGVLNVTLIDTRKTYQCYQENDLVLVWQYKYMNGNSITPNMCLRENIPYDFIFFQYWQLKPLPYYAVQIIMRWYHMPIPYIDMIYSKEITYLTDRVVHYCSHQCHSTLSRNFLHQKYKNTENPRTLHLLFC